MVKEDVDLVGHGLDATWILGRAHAPDGNIEQFRRRAEERSKRGGATQRTEVGAKCSQEREVSGGRTNTARATTKKRGLRLADFAVVGKRAEGDARRCARNCSAPSQFASERRPSSTRAPLSNARAPERRPSGTRAARAPPSPTAQRTRAGAASLCVCWLSQVGFPNRIRSFGVVPSHPHRSATNSLTNSISPHRPLWECGTLRLCFTVETHGHPRIRRKKQVPRVAQRGMLPAMRCVFAWEVAALLVMCMRHPPSARAPTSSRASPLAQGATRAAAPLAQELAPSQCVSTSATCHSLGIIVRTRSPTATDSLNDMSRMST